MPEKWIYRVEELKQDFDGSVGKKCANLGEMASIGLQVPPGFALSLTACSDFMERSGAASEIKKCIEKNQNDLDTIDGFSRISDILRDIVETKEMPSELRDAICLYYRELCETCGQSEVAVSTRSAGAKSHPGQYETYLNVIGESDVLQHVKKVWSSAFNPRSISARIRAGVCLYSDPIGVAVLKMVNARSAGVMFTADPNTGDDSKIIIEANWGLGESVVGGEAMPDVFILRKENLEVIERKMGSKARYIIFQDNGVAELEAPEEKRNTFCLTDEEAIQIGRFGKTLELHFGVPQDTEWAIDQEGKGPDRAFLLQTRPEIIAKQVKPVDQVIDLMLGQFGS